MKVFINKNAQVKMTAKAIRNELKTYIDSMSYESLVCVKPILSLLAESNVSTRLVRNDYVIESDLTKEETDTLMAGIKERAEHPETYIEWKPHNLSN